GLHDVRAVARAAHPRVDDLADGGLSGRDVLAERGPAIAGGVDTLGQRASVEARVREVVLRLHVLRMAGGRLGERVVPGHGPARRGWPPPWPCCCRRSPPAPPTRPPRSACASSGGWPGSTSTRDRKSRSGPVSCRASPRAA